MPRISAHFLVALLALPCAPTQGSESESANSHLPAAAQDSDRPQLERRFDSIGTLIERSSAARLVDSSSNADAKARRDAARRVYQLARDTFQAGDLKQAGQLLTDASLVMFDAVRLADPQKMSAQKGMADFGNKMESVKALLAALKRISAEKPDNESAKAAAEQIESEISEAQGLADYNEMASARVALEGAYLLAKASINALRSGDTLVRTLNFSSKEEEYRYELDRNDTHLMLIKLLVEDKRGAAALDDRARGFLENGRNLRTQAEADAARGNYAGAILLLEESTGEIIKTIRNAGVYVPG